MSKLSFFVVEFDGTENGPFKTSKQAASWADKNDLIAFESLEAADAHVAANNLVLKDFNNLSVIIQK